MACCLDVSVIEDVVVVLPAAAASARSRSSHEMVFLSAEEVRSVANIAFRPFNESSLRISGLGTLDRLKQVHPG